MALDQVNLGLLLLRLAVGGTMMAHGYNHVFRGGKIAGTGRWFDSLGMKPGKLHAWLASATELAAGACAGVMLVALIVNHRKNGFFIFRPGEGYEYVLNLAVACFAVACLGAGQWSIDDKIDFQLHDWWGLIWALLIGVGGTAVLLATFWRPPPPKPAAS